MPVRVSPPRLAWALLTLVAWAGAGFVVVDTLRAVVPLWSPLPWFDEWATVELIRSWQSGESSALQILFAQHNEHRILVPRLVFFADDLLFAGEGHLSLAAIVLVRRSMPPSSPRCWLGRARAPPGGGRSRPSSSP